jgi:hypothetical protein
LIPVHPQETAEMLDKIKADRPDGCEVLIRVVAAAEVFG